MKISDDKLDQLINEFDKQYIIKKKINAHICFLTSFCGLSAILYSVFVFHNSLLDRLRYMTFWGTIHASIISFIFGIICIYEARHRTEMTYKWAYFLRLSSATTELAIFLIVLCGLLPIFPDEPDISSYPGIMMHIIVPILTIVCFIFNDPPIGKLKLYEPLYGISFLALYACLMIILFGSGYLSFELAPYSFLDFKNSSRGFRIFCLIGINIIGFLVSKLLSYLNFRLSWTWLINLKKRR